MVRSGHEAHHPARPLSANSSHRAIRPALLVHHPWVVGGSPNDARLELENGRRRQGDFTSNYTKNIMTLPAEAARAVKGRSPRHMRQLPRGVAKGAGQAGVGIVRGTRTAVRGTARGLIRSAPGVTLRPICYALAIILSASAEAPCRYRLD